MISHKCTLRSTQPQLIIVYFLPTAPVTALRITTLVVNDLGWPASQQHQADTRHLPETGTGSAPKLAGLASEPSIEPVQVVDVEEGETIRLECSPQDG